MTRRMQWYLVGGIVALIAIALTISLLLFSDEIQLVGVGMRAPDFTAVTLDETPVAKSLEDYRGKVVLLNLWATWCEPCRVEMPSMEAIHRDYKDRGLSVVAVSVDDPGSEETVRKFVQELGLTFDILHDTTGKIDKAYQRSKVPESFVIRRDGVISRKIYGQLNWDSPPNRALLVQLLDEPVPRGAPPSGGGSGSDDLE